MQSKRDLVAAADHNLVGSFRKLAEHTVGGAVRSGDDVFAFRTGLPIAFNGCIVDHASSVEHVDEALGWLGSSGVPNRAKYAIFTRRRSTP